MPKDFPECYNVELEITEWQCGGMCDPIYVGKGEFIGYKSLCSSCNDNREAIFEYPCQDKFCLGGQIIRLKGSQVAGNRRNLAENPEWVFPPVRCSACRDWLKQASQLKKKCEACSTVFVIGAGRIKMIKKHEGDPSVFGPKFCSKCERLTEEERQKLTRKRDTYKKSQEDYKDNFKNNQLQPYLPVVYNQEQKLEVALDKLTSLVSDQQLAAMMQAHPIPVTTTSEDIRRYWQEPAKEGNRIKHFEEHLADFSPPFGNVKDMLGEMDRVMNVAEPGRVFNLVDRRPENKGNKLKIDMVAGTLVVFDKSNNSYITSYVPRGSNPSPKEITSYISMKIGKGDWGPPN